MKSRFIASAPLLLATLLAAAGVQAQQSRSEVSAGAHNMTSASATSNVPSRAGEASTMTNGVPNAVTSNPQPGEYGSQGRLTVRQAAMNQDRASATSGVAPRAGEMSSMVNGVPNLDPNDPALARNRNYASSSEPNLNVMGASGGYGYGYGSVSGAGYGDNATHGHGVKGGVGVPANAPAGTPSVFNGGTPE
jgi:hypothetical protein